MFVFCALGNNGLMLFKIVKSNIYIYDMLWIMDRVIYLYLWLHALIYLWLHALIYVDKRITILYMILSKLGTCVFTPIFKKRNGRRPLKRKMEDDLRKCPAVALNALHENF